MIDHDNDEFMESQNASQPLTQSTQSQTQGSSFSDFSPCVSGMNADQAWGQLDVYRVGEKRFGVRTAVDYCYTKIQSFDLIKERVVVGRNRGDIRVSELNELKGDKLDEISSTHFTLMKRDVSDVLCPVILEDCSTNGTFVRSNSIPKNMMKERLSLTAGSRKQRILTTNDTIFIQLNPTIAFTFRSFQTPYNDLPADLNRYYHIGRQLGSGACGTVYRVQHRRTCHTYALKYIQIEAMDSSNTPEREIELLRQLSHPCIVRMHDKSTYPRAVAIFLDFMAGGDLLGRIQQSYHLPEALTKCLFYQICCGVEYMHGQRITHRDLKPENILLATDDAETLVRISDFGLSRMARSNSMMGTRCGTEMYLAPEIQPSAKYTNKVDVWSLGIVLYNCLCGQYPFLADSAVRVVRFQQDVWLSVSGGAKSLIRAALRTNADQRPAIAQVLANGWLDRGDASVKTACDIMANTAKYSGEQQG